MSLYEQQLARVLERGVGSDPTLNPFWGKMVGKLQRAREKGRDLTPELVARNINTRGERLQPGAANRDDPDVAYVLSRLESPEGVEPDHADHLAGMMFLKLRRLVDPYLADMDRLGIRSSQQLVRTWWYIRRLKRHMPAPRATFLEVGGGAGHFAALAIDAALASHYVLVDLPEMILLAIATTTDLLPGYAAHVGRAPDFSEAPALWFLNTDEIGLVPDRSVGALMNFNSFSEMDDRVRDDYLAHFYRAGRPGALFYNVNRRHRVMSRVDGSTFENHPLLYPYRPDDELVEWEPDEYQQATRSLAFASPQNSFCISRISRLR